MKDGHQFVIHVINPKDDPHAPPEPKPEETAPSSGPTPDTEREKAELESSEKEGWTFFFTSTGKRFLMSF